MSHGILTPLRCEGREGSAKYSKLRCIGCKFALGGGKKSVKNRAAQRGFGELREKGLEFWGDHQNPLGLQGTPDPGDGLREMAVQQIDGFGGFGAWCHGTLEKISEKEPTFLEVGKDFFGGLRCRGDAKSREETPREAGERSLGCVKKVGVRIGSGSREQKGLDVDGAETRGPFEALQSAGDVLGGGELAAAIARQMCGYTHRQKW